MVMNAQIGQSYRYPNSSKKYKLTEISSNGFVYIFSCGHRCTDNVFADLINCSTGIQVGNDMQLQLF